MPSQCGTRLRRAINAHCPRQGAARPYGLLVHDLRNSVNRALSMAGLHPGLMFAGVLVTESAFSRPGIGRYLFESLGTSDFPAVAGVTFVLVTIYTASNTVVDIPQGSRTCGSPCEPSARARFGQRHLTPTPGQHGDEPRSAGRVGRCDRD